MIQNVSLTGGGNSFLVKNLLALKKEFFWIGAYGFIANILTLSSTLYLLQIYDRVMLSRSELTLIVLTLILVVFVGVMAFAEWIRSSLLISAGVRFDSQLNTQIFFASFHSNLEKLRPESMSAFFSLTRLRQFLTGEGIIAFFDLPWTSIYLGMLFMMHPLLGWFGIGFTLILAVFAWVGATFTSRPLEAATRAEREASNYLAGKLRNAEAVESMGMKGNLKRRWLVLYRDQVDAYWSAQERGGFIAACSKFLQYSQQSLVLAIGAWLTLQGELTLGAMIAANVMMANALRPITMLVGIWKEFIQARQSYNDIDKLLKAYPSEHDGRVAKQINGQLTLKEFCAYAFDRKKPILDHIDVRFEAGEVIGIVGPSGAGKSTLARCLIGIWPSTSGKLLLDDVSIGDWSREFLGPHIGYLPQDIELFDGTVAENICRFGELDSAAILDAAKRVGIHDMILRLPAGYDTPIGQAGKLLSGGQRQRLALARAIYGLPDLVVLDEPSSNLDDIGESALGQVIRELKAAGKTVFIVVHHRNLLALADRVVVMNNGRITNLGRVALHRTANADS